MSRTGSAAIRTCVSRSGSTVTVSVAGELDLATAGQLRSCLAPLVSSDPPPATLVLDLAELAFLDASGISALLAVQRRLAAHGGRVVLRSPSALVRRVLRVLDLDQVLPVER